MSKTDSPLRLTARIIHVDLHEKAIELRLGQRVGALLLNGILGCQDMERTRHVVAVAGHGDVVLLHCLQQCGLGARACAVDLVRHQELAENRAGNEAEASLPAGTLFEHLAAENVRRHQIGSKLDTARLEPKHNAHGLHQLGLGQPGKSDEQGVAAA